MKSEAEGTKEKQKREKKTGSFNLTGYSKQEAKGRRMLIHNFVINF